MQSTDYPTAQHLRILSEYRLVYKQLLKGWMIMPDPIEKQLDDAIALCTANIEAQQAGADATLIKTTSQKWDALTNEPLKVAASAVAHGSMTRDEALASLQPAKAAKGTDASA